MISRPAGHTSALLIVLLLAISCTQSTRPSEVQGTPVRIKRTILSPEERPSCQSVVASSSKRRHTTELNGGGATLRDLSTNSTNQLNGGQPALAASAAQQQTVNNKQPAQQGTTNKVETSERLRQLRQLLVSNNYDAYLITPNDEHGSEYVADFDRRLRFISGFSGSNGYALITLDRAVLFTDGRYALQAELDLDCNWSLVVGSNPILDVPVWVKTHASRRALRLATDARLMSLQVFDYLDSELKRQDSAFEFALISLDLVDVVWNNMEERVRSANSLTIHPLEFAGQVSWQEKVLKLADLMARSRARYYVISKLDDIAWLLNLRGSDIPMAPLFKAYLLVTRQPTGQTSASAGRNIGRLSLDSNSSDQTTRFATSSLSTSPPSGTTSPSVQLSLEQLLAGASIGNQQQQQQQVPAKSGDTLPNLQSPQVVQVPASQLIKVTLYVDLRKVTPQIREHLRLATSEQQHSSNGSAASQLAHGDNMEHLGNGESRIQVELKDYDVFIMDFGERFRSQGAANQPYNSHSSNSLDASPSGGSGDSMPSMAGGKLLLDAMANVAIHVLAKNYDDRLILVEPLCQRLKSVKTDLEVVGMRQAHWRDSLAIAMLLSQLEHDIGVRKRTEKWTEVSAAGELEFYRSLMDYNRGQSFDTISAYGPNGAIIHYRPDPQSTEQVRIGNQSTYLLDSGGQYLDGTTDITRTVHFGQPSDFQRETYTRVLMGAIDMMSLIFELPQERSPHRLNDLIARRHLFDVGLNYEHGTGHGIGLYSLVHESPALIVNYDHLPATSSSNKAQQQQQQQQSKFTSSVAIQDEPLSIRENMFTSVEPGFYKANQFGIRLENIVVTQRLAWTNDERSVAGENQTRGGRSWLRFEPISLVPFEPKLIKLELLSNKQKAWLNSYNLMVRLRMTQQINYYLTKVRHQQQQHQQVLVHGAVSASRLYRRLHEQNSTAAAATAVANETRRDLPLVDEARQNFMRMEPNRLQQLLEQTHRWIMSKTELISLDVPQRMRVASSNNVATGGGESNLDGRAQQTAANQAPHAGPAVANDRTANADERPVITNTHTNGGGEDEWSALGAHPKGQRLMLAYMASLPFNDASAARALATSLAGRSELTVDEQRQQQQQATTAGKADLEASEGQPLVVRSNNSFPVASAAAFDGHQKCSGIECDLLLLEALNSHQRQLASRPVRQSDTGDHTQQQQQQQQQQQSNGRHQILMDLFQIRSPSLPDASELWRSLVANMWPILGLAVIITLQLAVVVYVCASRGGRGQRNGARHSASMTSGARLRSPSMSWVLNSGAVSPGAGDAGRRRASCGRIESSAVAEVHEERSAISLAGPGESQQRQQPLVITENI